MSTSAPRLHRRASLLRFCLAHEFSARRLQVLTEALCDSTRLDELIPQILDGALALTGAGLGNVQLLDPDDSVLLIAAQEGFDDAFLTHFARVCVSPTAAGHGGTNGGGDGDGSACGRAARLGTQTVIADIWTDEAFRPHRDVASVSGFRAVQSTPLISHTGRLIGMVSTHFQRPGPPSASQLAALEVYGELAGEALGRCGEFAADGVGSVRINA